VRTAFGRAGAQGIFWKTRADDMAVKVVRELLRATQGFRRSGSAMSSMPPRHRSAIRGSPSAATLRCWPAAAVRSRLRGRPHVPGALTAVTAGAGEIAYGACDIVLAGGVEHMGHHPMGDDVDFNPRFVSSAWSTPRR